MAESSSTITTSYVSSPIAVFAICRRRRRPSRKWQPNLGSRCAKMTFSQKNFPSSFDCPMWHAPAYSSDTPMSSAPSSGVAYRRNFEPEKYPKCFLTKRSGDLLQVSRRLPHPRRFDLTNGHVSHAHPRCRDREYFFW